jgi:hypothetical protein
MSSLPNTDSRHSTDVAGERAATEMSYAAIKQERFRRKVGRVIARRHAFIRPDQESPTRKGRQSPGLLSSFVPSKELLDTVSDLGDGVQFIDFGEPKNANKDTTIQMADRPISRRPSFIPVPTGYMAELHKENRQIEKQSHIGSKKGHIRGRSIGNPVLGSGTSMGDPGAGASYHTMRAMRSRSSLHVKQDK